MIQIFDTMPLNQITDDQHEGEASNGAIENKNYFQTSYPANSILFKYGMICQFGAISAYTRLG